MSEEIMVAKPKSEVALIFDKITDGLMAFETRKEEFMLLAEEAEAIKITTYEDKANLKRATELRKKIKSARVKVENEGKAMRDPLTSVTKEISAKQKELTDIVAPGEKSMAQIEDWYEAEEQRLEREAEEKEKARIQARIDRLPAYGYQIDYNMLISLGDEDFERIVSNAKVEFEKEEAAKVEKERQEQAQREQDEKDRAELKALRAKQEEADKILKEREQEIARKEAEMKRKEEEDRIMAEKELEKKMKDARFEPRKVQLLAMGFTTYGDPAYPDFSLKDTWSTYWEQVYNMSDQEWPKYIKDIEDAIERRKVRLAEEEKKRAADLEEARQKGIREAKEAEERKSAEEAERIAQSSDKDKLDRIIEQFQSIAYPEMKSAKAKKLVSEVKDLQAKIVAHIKAKM
jgi:hypothetical protein